MITPPKLLEITDWKQLALDLYRKAHGRRCVSCGAYVDPSDAAMFTVDGIDEVILVHEGCKT
jgi:hypothetical protein